jgi:hypothetical protein
MDQDVTGAQSSRHILQLTARRPELKGWDWVHDVRHSSGEVGNPDVAEVARAFVDSPPGPTWTVFVTEDRNFGLWCKVMDARFRGRLHLTALTVEDALRQLDALRALNGPGRAPSSS